MIKEIVSWLLKAWMLAIVVLLFIIADQAKHANSAAFYRKLHRECKMVTDSHITFDKYEEWLCPDGVTHRVNK